MPRERTTVTTFTLDPADAEELVTEIWIALEQEQLPTPSMRVHFETCRISIAIGFEQGEHARALRNALRWAVDLAVEP
jgi:hypothetical protein